MEVIDLPDARSVRYERDSFQTSGGVTDVSPWALVLIPRCDRPLVAEENTQSLKDHPPVWTARGKLDR